MGYRIFTDRQGTEWQAWDIIPRLAERRARQRRTSLAAVSGERRAAPDRRVQLGERPLLSKGLHAGWLCFETRAEKRRLAPVPSDWLSCAAAKLEEYLSRAIPAVRSATGLELPVLPRLGRGAG